MSLIVFAAVALILFVILNVIFAVSMNLVFVANRRPLLWILVAAAAAFGLSWLALRLGAGPSAVTTACVGFGVARLWGARPPGGIDGEMFRDLRREAWVQAGLPHGATYTWMGVAAMVALGVAATVETCDLNGVCRPLI